MHKIWQSHNATVSIRHVFSTSYLYVFIYIQSCVFCHTYVLFCRTHVFFTDLTIINGLFRLRSSSEINIIIRRVKVSMYIDIQRNPAFYHHASRKCSIIYRWLRNYISYKHHLSGMAFHQYVYPFTYLCG